MQPNLATVADIKIQQCLLIQFHFFSMKCGFLSGHSQWLFTISFSLICANNHEFAGKTVDSFLSSSRGLKGNPTLLAATLFAIWPIVGKGKDGCRLFLIASRQPIRPETITMEWLFNACFDAFVKFILVISHIK